MSEIDPVNTGTTNTEALNRYLRQRNKVDTTETTNPQTQTQEPTTNPNFRGNRFERVPEEDTVETTANPETTDTNTTTNPNFKAAPAELKGVEFVKESEVLEEDNTTRNVLIGTGAVAATVAIGLGILYHKGHTDGKGVMDSIKDGWKEVKAKFSSKKAEDKKTETPNAEKTKDPQVPKATQEEIDGLKAQTEKVVKTIQSKFKPFNVTKPELQFKNLCEEIEKQPFGKVTGEVKFKDGVFVDDLKKGTRTYKVDGKTVAKFHYKNDKINYYFGYDSAEREIESVTMPDEYSDKMKSIFTSYDGEHKMTSSVYRGEELDEVDTIISSKNGSKTYQYGNINKNGQYGYCKIKSTNKIGCHTRDYSIDFDGNGNVTHYTLNTLKPTGEHSSAVTEISDVRIYNNKIVSAKNTKYDNEHNPSSIVEYKK